MAHLPHIGTLSSGTVNRDHLVYNLAVELDYLNGGDSYVERLAKLVDPDDADWTILPDCDNAADDLLSEIMSALDDLAPAYCYFGTHPGDGADFGFWPDMETIEEFPRISDPSDLDNIIGDDVQENRLYVNDHGNVTVYGHFAGEGWKALLEIV